MIPLLYERRQRIDVLEHKEQSGKQMSRAEKRELKELRAWFEKERKADHRRLMRSISENDRYAKRVKNLSVGTY